MFNHPPITENRTTSSINKSKPKNTEKIVAKNDRPMKMEKNKKNMSRKEKLHKKTINQLEKERNIADNHKEKLCTCQRCKRTVEFTNAFNYEKKGFVCNKCMDIVFAKQCNNHCQTDSSKKENRHQAVDGKRKITVCVKPNLTVRSIYQRQKKSRDKETAITQLNSFDDMHKKAYENICKDNKRSIKKTINCKSYYKPAYSRPKTIGSCKDFTYLNQKLKAKIINNTLEYKVKLSPSSYCLTNLNNFDKIYKNTTGRHKKKNLNCLKYRTIQENTLYHFEDDLKDFCENGIKPHLNKARKRRKRIKKTKILDRCICKKCYGDCEYCRMKEKKKRMRSDRRLGLDSWFTVYMSNRSSKKNV